jgi:protease IV
LPDKKIMVETNSTTQASNANSNHNWQQQTLEKVLLETIKEQRRKRRWGVFFKLLGLGFFLLLLFTTCSTSKLMNANRLKRHVSLIDIRGEIFDGENASSDNIASSLNRAFKDPYTKAVIMRINSPGGSPVQASYVYNEVLRQKKLHPKVKVYAVCSDVCASAAYYIASSADYIYANPASLVGSIGVLMNGFGFTGALDKVGVERRLLKSGDEKGFLDPFSPMTQKDKDYAQAMLNIVHQQFINDVKKGRGDRLKNSPELFSGLAWTGQQALQLGLIDGFGSTGYVARDIIKISNVVDYTKKSSIFDRLSKNIGAAFYHQFATEFGLSGPVLN